MIRPYLSIKRGLIKVVDWLVYIPWIGLASVFKAAFHCLWERIIGIPGRLTSRLTQWIVSRAEQNDTSQWWCSEKGRWPWLLQIWIISYTYSGVESEECPYMGSVGNYYPSNWAEFDQKSYIGFAIQQSPNSIGLIGYGLVADFCMDGHVVRRIILDCYQLKDCLDWNSTQHACIWSTPFITSTVNTALPTW